LPIYLPNFLAAGNDFFKDYGLLIPYSIVGIDVLALFLVASIKPRTPEQLWLTVAMLAAVVDVWLTTQGLHRFSLGWYVAKVGSLFTSLAVLISLFHGITTLYRSASDRANRDGLTGLNNRRRLNETLNIEWKRARRQAGVLSFLMIDVDAFKQYNDTYGHLRGDECLRRIASVLLSSVNRPGDMVARYGGEEFCALLPATDAQGAVFIAHQIGAAIRADRIAHAGSANGIVTVSIGVATCRPNVGTRFEDLIDAADQALYRAKDAGRNRVEVNELEFKLA
jgi:diguanylate cyclase (GGDEF)-like protein